MSVFDRGRARFEALTSRQKRLLVTGSTVLSVGCLLYVLVNVGDSRDKREDGVPDTASSITLDSRLLEDSLGEGVRAEQRAQATVIAELGATLKEIGEDMVSVRQALKAVSDRQAEGVTLSDLAPKNELASMEARAAYPPPVIHSEKRPELASDLTRSQMQAGPVRGAELEPAVRHIRGGIAGIAPVPVSEPQKKTLKSIYLPVGFMDAVLLTGVDSMVGGEAQSNPEPVLARVQAPAVLPNHVRANLQGCFVVGNAMGVLAKERVEVRAVSLSCIDYNERTVIDEAIKGYFVDTDGKKGLSGNVVTRDGAVVGRAFAAGVLEGFGSVVETGAGTQSVSPLGTTQVFSTKEAAVAGLGSGVSGAAGSLKDYYLDLAKTITPVIEVGTGKRFVLVIQEGVTLNIREVGDVEQG
ncbi:TraB/VirB10 family protein [Kordiimonas pumila]|uniref:TraB/VirB10 family protein n=1 Tax=Kordiimonas pumila TaxID=2161677 RepID=A0ABV7D6S3_9PROT|nr:TraB/VirB10 family protein [Kordiimonas pumila]